MSLSLELLKVAEVTFVQSSPAWKVDSGGNEFGEPKAGRCPALSDQLPLRLFCELFNRYLQSLVIPVP
jgi:hypothetical protein